MVKKFQVQRFFREINFTEISLPFESIEKSFNISFGYIYGQDLILFKQKLTLLKQKQGLVLDYKEW
jgi:hypothetical protein